VVEDIITALTRFRLVRHRAQFVLRLQGARGRHRQVGRELGVRYVLEGSVRRSVTGCASPAS
jgi:TolB-like protein